jgi:hypothetical protein
MQCFHSINNLFLDKTITAKEYRTAMSGYLKNLGPEETKRVFTDSVLCPHFYQEYTESDQGFTHFCEFCPEDFTFKKE